jgi:sugar phosphate isomerase/epimerase
MIYSRRDFGRIALASVPLANAFAAKINSKFNGVQVGAITYSFRGTNDLDLIIKDLVDCGIGEVELMETDAERAAGAPQIGRGGGRPGGGGPGKGPGGGKGPDGAAKGDGAPKGPPQRTARPPMTEEQITAARERAKPVRDWRLAVSMDKFKDVKKKFDEAGVEIRLVCFNMTEAITEEEIDYAFNMAKALGAKALSSTTQVTVSKRVAPFADKHKMMIGFHGHDATWDPNEFATPESFATAMSYSKYHGINLDIGHFTAANYDAVAYIKQHHARITNLHIKDRKKDHGPNEPFGEGETPIKPVLQLLKKEKYDIPANIEYEYGKPGMDAVTEVKKCVQYCKDALA